MTHEVCLEMLRKDAAGGALDVDLVEQFCAIPADELALPTDATPSSHPSSR
jgi:hypothetical protein